MIIYFANRRMEVLGQASTGLPRGFFASDDKKIEDVDTGVASFECTVSFEKSEQRQLQEVVKAGNYILRSNGDEKEFYTIIDSELDIDDQEIYLYAEDAGLDLLNDVAQAFEATEAYPIKWYVEKWTEDSGFEIGINEIPDLSRKLKWDGESTVTERLASVATQFDNAEISYTFDVDKLQVLHKYINIHKKRGKDTGEVFRINKNLNNIVIKSSVANLATALYVTGGTPEGQEDPITLAGYKYDDGDFYLSEKYLKSRKAVKKWSRYLSETGTGEGHIEKTYSFDTTSQKELCAHAVTELKKICDTEVNYEVDIAELPQAAKIGDRINLVDDNGELYLSARILKLEISIAKDSQKATLGEYLIKSSGISDKVQALASQFAELAKNRVYYTWIVYADDENGNGISLDPDGKAYVGIAANRKTMEPDLTDPIVYKWSKVEGDPGKSLVSITEHYLVSDQDSGITIDTTGWSTGSSVPVMTPEKKYLWNYETLTYSDGSTENLAPKIIGVYGDTGKDGKASPSIVTMTKQYYLSTSSTEMTSGEWVRSLPEWTTGKFLWSRWCTEWSEPNPTLLTYSDGILETTWNEVHETAAAANTLANTAKNIADSALTKVGEVNSELETANQEMDALQASLETLSNEMITSYAKKSDLTQISTDLGTRIDQNAAQISSTATKVDQVEINASTAISDAAAAKTAADQAQEAANTAQTKYTELKNRADATDEEVAAAKAAADQAQADATAAGDAAAAAQSAANSLADRVTSAETSITQNANAISSLATKVSRMRIGGRNYVLDSMDPQVSTETLVGSYELSEDWEAGEIYTLSFEGTKTAGTFAAYCDAGYAVILDDLTINENTGRYECTFTCPAAYAGEPAQAANVLTIHNLPASAAHNCTVQLVKLEKSNTSSDWTPAPEDNTQFVNETIRNATTNILQTAENVTISILQGYTTTTDLESYKEEVRNLFKANSDSFQLEFNQLEERINDVGNEIVERNQFIRLEQGNIIIGKSDSPVQAKFTNDALEFKYNEQTVARFTNEVLEVRNIAVQNQIRFGDNWAIRLGAYINGKGNNLNDVWIGG